MAHAFNVPPDVVFRKAGILPDRPDAPDPGIREITHLYDQLSDQDQEEVLAIVRTICREKLSRYGKPPQTQTSET